MYGGDSVELRIQCNSAEGFGVGFLSVGPLKLEFFCDEMVLGFETQESWRSEQLEKFSFFAAEELA